MVFETDRFFLWFFFFLIVRALLPNCLSNCLSKHNVYHQCRLATALGTSQLLGDDKLKQYYKQTEAYKTTLHYMNTTLTGLFTLECVMKIFSFGFRVRRPLSTIFDFSRQNILRLSITLCLLPYFDQNIAIAFKLFCSQGFSTTKEETYFTIDSQGVLPRSAKSASSVSPGLLDDYHFKIACKEWWSKPSVATLFFLHATFSCARLCFPQVLLLLP